MILAGTTSILIALRLSTVKSAERIIVMENGGIIETGSDEGLDEFLKSKSNFGAEA